MTKNEIRAESLRLFTKVQDVTLLMEDRVAAFESLVHQAYGPWQKPSATNACTLRGHCTLVAQIAIAEFERENESTCEWTASDLAGRLLVATFMLAPQISDLREFITRTAMEVLDGSFGRGNRPAA